MKNLRSSFLLTALIASLFSFCATSYADFQKDVSVSLSDGTHCQVRLYVTGVNDPEDRGTDEYLERFWQAIEAAIEKAEKEGCTPISPKKGNPFKEANKNNPLVDVTSGGNSTHVPVPVPDIN